MFAHLILAATALFPTIANLSYSGHPENLLDLVQPAPAALTNRPLVIFVGPPGARPANLTVATPLIQKGFVVAILDYRPGAPSLTDVLEAVRWLHDHASQYKLDWSHAVIAGIGDGATLATLATLLPEGNEYGPSTPLAAAIAINPPQENDPSLTKLTQKGRPPILSVTDPLPEAWPKIFKWLRKAKLLS